MANMKGRLLTVVGAGMLTGSMFANAVVLTFDDVPAQNDFTGNTYNEWTLTEAGIYNNLWDPASVSGDNYITNYNSRVGVFARATAFDYVGAYFTADGRYQGADGQQVLVSGLNDVGASVFSELITLTTSPQFFNFNWDGIYGISWDPTTPDINNIGIDNFTYDADGGPGPDPSPAPAPATLALFGLGLVGLGWSRRKKA